LIINVLDIDDNCPVFDPKEYNVTIQENVPYETPIVQVNAKDVDTVGAKLEYGIRSGNTATTFKIHRYKGEGLFLVSMLERSISSKMFSLEDAVNNTCYWSSVIENWVILMKYVNDIVVCV
jgi:hypothetical protein